MNASTDFSSETFALFAITVLLVLLTLLVTRRRQSHIGVIVLVITSLMLFVVTMWLLSFLPAEIFYIGVPALTIVTTYIFWRRGDRQKEHRAVAGKCTECGYDLRASVQRCPECGADLSEEIVRRRRIAAELRATRNAGAPPGSEPKPESE